MPDNVETMAYAGETPWHGIGTPVSNDMSPKQMQKASGTDWRVEVRPLMFPVYKKGKFGKPDLTSEPELVEVPNQKALVRDKDNRLLTIITDNWNPTQNDDAFKFFVDFVAAGKMEMHTAGSLDNGRNVWVLAKVKSGFTILGKDRVESYLLFSLPHIYGKSIHIQFTPIRVVCANTLAMSLGTRRESEIRIDHRKPFDPEKVKTLLGIAHHKLDYHKQVAELLSGKKFKQDTLMKFFGEVFPVTGKKAEEGAPAKLSRPAMTAYSVMDTQPGAEFGKGTWWQAFNAVTYTTDHLLGHTPETRLESIWYGQNRDRKLEALEKAVEYAKAA